jgi:hypothetical protein
MDSYDATSTFPNVRAWIRCGSTSYFLNAQIHHDPTYTFPKVQTKIFFPAMHVHILRPDFGISKYTIFDLLRLDIWIFHCTKLHTFRSEIHISQSINLESTWPNIRLNPIYKHESDMTQHPYFVIYLPGSIKKRHKYFPMHKWYLSLPLGL